MVYRHTVAEVLKNAGLANTDHGTAVEDILDSEGRPTIYNIIKQMNLASLTMNDDVRVYFHRL